MNAGTYRRVFAHPKRVMGGAGVFVAICAWLCMSLSLDTDLLNLLPEDVPAIRSIRKLESWDGATAFHYIGLVRDEATSVETLKRFADEIGVDLNKSKWLKPTEVGVQIHRIKKAAALFLDPEDLRIVGERVLEHVKRERKKATGFFLDLEEEGDGAASTTLSFDDLLPKYKRRFQWTDDKKDPGAASRDKARPDGEEGAETIRKVRAKLNADATVLYYLSKDGRMLVWLTAPIFRPRDLSHYPEMQADVDAAIASARARVEGTGGIEVHIGGGYAMEWDQRVTTLKDAARATALAAALILVIIAVTLRRLRAVVLVCVALVAGLIVTFGLVQLTIGRLNVVTVFLMAILGGLGIDFGLYFATRFTRFRRLGQSRDEAAEAAWVQTATPALMGALTTCSATALLSFGEFQGFAELGVIATIGIVSTWATMYGLLPALYLVFMPATAVGEMSEDDLAAGPPAAHALSPAGPRAGLFVGVAVVVTLALAWSARDVRFGVTGKELTVDDQPSLVIDQKIIDHYGENVDPTLILAETEEEARAIHRKFQERFGTFDTISRYESAFTYVPSSDPAHVAAIQEAIKPLKKALRRMPGKVEDPERQWFLDQARSLVDPVSLTVEDLPTHIQRVYLGRSADGKTSGYIGHVIPNDWLWEVEYLKKHVDEVASIRIDGKPIEATGRSQILLRLIEIVQKEATVFSLVGALVILLMFWLQTRSLRFALLCMLPLLIGTVWTLGVLPLLGERGLWLSFVNLTIVPVLIGLAVSYGVHLVHNYRLYGSADRSLRVTGRAVMASALTTLVGWSSLLPASMTGMRRIGQLACVGMITVTLASLILLPATLALFDRLGWIRPDGETRVARP